jgi:hypothetical protein
LTSTPRKCLSSHCVEELLQRDSSLSKDALERAGDQGAVQRDGNALVRFCEPDMRADLADNLET